MRRWQRTTAFGAFMALMVGSLAAIPATSATAAGEEIIVNGGFENNTNGWEIRNGGNLWLDPDKTSGNSSGFITHRESTQSGPWQNITGKVQAGKTYTVSARVKYKSGPATKQFFITNFYGGGSYTNLAGATIPKNTWGTISGTFTIPSTQSVAEARLFIETPWVANPANDRDNNLMNFRVDDVSLKEVTGGTPTNPTDPGNPANPIMTTNHTVHTGVQAKKIGDGNPLVSHKFGADPYHLVYNGRVYMYMTNDTQEWAARNNGGSKNTYAAINTLSVISSSDLVNWTDHGNIAVAGPNGAAKWANNSWAPAVAVKKINGKDKFFLYFANNGSSIGVLTADSPTGPWVDPIGKPIVNAQTPGASNGKNWLFDPAVLVDDDGQGYLYFGGGGEDGSGSSQNENNPKSSRVIKLGANMISTSGSAAVIDAPAIFESSGIHKRNGKYYYSYSSNFGNGGPGRLPGYPAHGVIAYMMADNPMGPWTPAQYKGTVLPNMYQFFQVGGNNHQSFFEFNGKWYISYHAGTLDKALNNNVGGNTKGYRSTHLNEVTYNADGTMRVVNADYKGVAQVGRLRPYSVNEAETIGWQNGVTTTNITEGSRQFPGSSVNLAVNNIHNNDWIGVGGVDFGSSGAASITAKVKPLTNNGTIEVRLGSPDRNSSSSRLVATLNANTPANQWRDITAQVSGATGVQNVYFVFRGGSGALMEFDSWSFTQR